ncbi:hypothetical protein HQ545_00480, partial [Candidatus Woesearchaeota archaeon]|nr:hypothetical protein [Candidatus Woesearchaeota archaeon]
MKAAILLIAIALVLFLAGPAEAAETLSADAQRVFEAIGRINIEHFYEQYWSLVDLAIYLVLFVSLSQLSLGKHLTGRHGRMVALAVGLSLSLGLVLTESAMGFNLRSFGPVAALITVGAVGLVIAISLTKLGMHKTTAASASFAMMYFSLQAVTPGLYSWMYQRAPWMSILLFLCLIYAIVQATRQLLPRTWKIRGPIVAAPEGRSGRSIEQEEKAVRGVHIITRKEHKNTKAMRNALKRLIKHIRKGKPKTQIITELQTATFNNEGLVKQTYALKDLTERLRAMDIVAYHKMREQYTGTVLKEHRKHLRKEVHGELDMLKVEKKLEEHEKLIDESTLHTRNYLALAATHIDKGEDETAITIIGKAVQAMDTIEKATHQMGMIENKLMKLLEKEHTIAERET